MYSHHTTRYSRADIGHDAAPIRAEASPIQAIILTLEPNYDKKPADWVEDTLRELLMDFVGWLRDFGATCFEEVLDQFLEHYYHESSMRVYQEPTEDQEAVLHYFFYYGNAFIAAIDYHRIPRKDFNWGVCTIGRDQLLLATPAWYKQNFKVAKEFSL